MDTQMTMPLKPSFQSGSTTSEIEAVNLRDRNRSWMSKKPSEVE